LRQVGALTQAARTSFEILALIETLQAENLFLPTSLITALRATLDEMAAILDRGEYPLDVDCPSPENPPGLSPNAAEIFLRLKIALETFAQAAPDGAAQAAEKKSGAFFLPDAFSNPEHVRYAIKTTTAAMICYILYTLLDWPGIHTCLITCYIVSLGTTAETIEKLSLRIAGCLVGAAAGIAAMIFLIPHFTSIAGLIIVVFLGAFAAAWVAGGSPRISYAGYQIAFAFFLCVIQGSAPAFDLSVARDRVIGILLGNLVVYLIFANIWPVSVASRIDDAAARLLRELGGLLASVTPHDRQTRAAQARATLSRIALDLELVRYEPVSVRPAESWIDARRRALGNLGDLYRSVLLLGASRPAGVAEIAHGLDGLADSLDAGGDDTSHAAETSPLENAAPETEAAQSHFLEKAKEHLRKLEEEFRSSESADMRAPHATA
jgi:multidrug resistance protein MdtO